MRLVARTQDPWWLEEGPVGDGGELETVPDGRSGGELRYAVCAPDGRPATFVTSERPLAGRRERSRFRKLAARRAKLDHPAAIAVRDVSVHAGYPVMITDPYPARTFGDLLEHEGPLSPERVVTMLGPVAEAIDLAHRSELVHQTLSGDSLLVAARDTLLLDSFGLLAADDEAPGSSFHAPDVRYRPPEQLHGEPTDASSNIYSLTALIVHALTGEAPYVGDRQALIYSHVADAPPRVSTRLPELGHEIDAVVEWGMAKARSERPSSATELLRLVADALGTPPPPTTVPAPATQPASARPQLQLAPAGPDRIEATPARTRRRARRGALAAAGLAAAIACGALAAVAVKPFGGDAPAVNTRPAGAAAWNRLADHRAELRDRLARAGTPQEQAAVASQLSAMYSGAAAAGGRPRLADAAREAAAAYSQLASAAEGGDASGYVEATRAVSQTEERLATTTARR
jgi:protein kinase-like protein